MIRRKCQECRAPVQEPDWVPGQVPVLARQGAGSWPKREQEPARARAPELTAWPQAPRIAEPA